MASRLTARPGADSKFLLTACDDMHSHLYDVEHASLVEAFSGAQREQLLCHVKRFQSCWVDST